MHADERAAAAGVLSVARNAGIRLSDGSIIAFIDGDAVADPAWLSELAKPFLAGADTSTMRRSVRTASWDVAGW